MGTKISALPAVTTMVDADIVPYDQAGTTSRGTGLIVKTYCSLSPTLVTPTLGVAAATSINRVAITAPATSATLTIADGKTLTVSNILTLTATDGSTLAIGGGGTLGTAAYTAASAYAVLGANTFTALQTITQASANAGILASTGYSLTGSNATNMVDLAGTWNTSGTPAAIKVNITNTASGATAKLIDLQVGGVSKLSFIPKTGVLSIRDLDFSGVTGTLDGGSTALELSLAGTVGVSMRSGTFRVGSGFTLGFSSAASPGGGANDTALERVSAGVMGVNNGSIGVFRDMKLRNLISPDANGSYIQTPGMAVTDLPAAPVRGMRCYVTDSNAVSYTAGIGAIVANGGTTVVPVFYNGTNWLIG